MREPHINLSLQKQPTHPFATFNFSEQGRRCANIKPRRVNSKHFRDKRRSSGPRIRGEPPDHRRYFRPPASERTPATMNVYGIRGTPMQQPLRRPIRPQGRKYHRKQWRGNREREATHAFPGASRGMAAVGKGGAEEKE